MWTLLLHLDNKFPFDVYEGVGTYLVKYGKCINVPFSWNNKSPLDQLSSRILMTLLLVCLPSECLNFWVYWFLVTEWYLAFATTVMSSFYLSPEWRCHPIEKGILHSAVQQLISCPTLCLIFNFDARFSCSCFSMVWWSLYDELFNYINWSFWFFLKNFYTCCTCNI